MKLAIVHWFYHPYFLGGGETVVQTLAEGLLAAGHEPVVISLSPERGITEARVNGVKVYYVGLTNVYWPLNAGRLKPLLKPLWYAIDIYNPVMARRVGLIVDRERPALVHTNGIDGFSTAVWREVKARGLPCVHSMHSYQLICPRGTMFRAGSNCPGWCWDCRLFGMPRRSTTATLDAAVGDSQFLMRRHLALGFFQQTPLRRVIYYGCTVPIDPPEVRVRSDRKLRIGYLGRLHPTKGVELLLRAVMTLPPDRYEVRLGGAGSSRYERELRRGFGSPSVQFMGFVNAHEFLSQIDVLAVPSLWQEPFGLVIAEAYAHGVPVLASNRGGIAELIQDGDTGFLFDPARPDSLTELLSRFVQQPDLPARMRPRILQRARDFAPQRMVRDYLMLYNEVLDSPARQHNSTEIHVAGVPATHPRRIAAQRG